MTREERLQQLFKALNEGRISEEAYDQALMNMDNFEYDEDYERAWGPRDDEDDEE